MMQDQPIFITGGTGLVGSYVLRMLVDRGYTNLSALKRRTSQMDLVLSVADQIKWIEGDITDSPFMHEILRDQDAVIHSAALIGFAPKARQNMHAVNVLGTANVVDACLANQVRRLIHVSSTAALGRDRKVDTIDETHPWAESKYNTPYALTKYLAEMEVWRGAAEGLKMAIVNPSIILGAGFWKSGSISLFHKLWKGVPGYSGGSNGIVDVRDVAAMVIQLLERPEIVNERFIASGAQVTFRELFSMICKHLEIAPPRRRIPDSLLVMYGWMMELVGTLTAGDALVTRSSARTSTCTLTYLNAKSREQLNFTYRSLEDTIRETALLFRQAAKKNFDPMVLPF